MTVTTDLIFDVLQQIADVRGSKDKAELLKKAWDHPLFQRVIIAAVNPFVTYGMQKMPNIGDNTGIGTFDPETWLLLDKLQRRTLTGDAAKDAVRQELERLTAKSREILKRIIQKDLRAGFSDTLVNAVAPGSVPVFTCMRGQDFDLKKLERMAKKAGKPAWPLYADYKYDGLRALFIVDLDAGTAYPVSRNGLPLSSLDWLKDEALEVARAAKHHIWVESTRFVIDGEGIVGDGKVFEDAASALKTQDIAAKGATVRVIDILPWEQFTGAQPSEDQRFRRCVLAGLLPPGNLTSPHFRPTESRMVDSYEELIEVYEEVLDQGIEGLIAKPTFGPYETKKSPYWLKLKLEETYDIQVVDAYEGEGQFAGSLGGVTVDFKGVQLNVGGGYTPAERAQFWADHTNHAVDYVLVDPKTKASQTLTAHPTGKPLVDRVFEVLSNGVTRKGSLRHPRFIRDRFDLRPEEVEGNK